jgi:CHAT domain-containing protein
MDEIPRADVAHFAAHYEVDPRSTLASKLLLAPDATRSAHQQRSGLSAGDIYGMNLARTRLVILAGCKTGIEQQFGGEGPVGFARSFLVAGVPVVVASLWPVDSDATSQLMIAFHRFRRGNHLPTTEALKLAQKEIMVREHYRHPYYWAGFIVIGGHSDF